MPKKKKIKCTHCKIKLSIINITCECNNKYCFKCMYPHVHNCTFNKDRIQLNKDLLEKNNIKIESKKVIEI